MLTFFNTKICNVLIIVWLWPTGISGNSRCSICAGASPWKCPTTKTINSCPVCAKVVNVSGNAITGVRSYCDPSCQQVGCDNSTQNQSSCTWCCKSPKCTFSPAAKLLFCFFNLAVSFIINESLVKAVFTKDTKTSSPEYEMIMANFTENLRRTRGDFTYRVKPGSIMTHPNGSVELNLNINVWYRQWLFDMESIASYMERTMTTSAAKGSLRYVVERTLRFRAGSDNLAHHFAKIAPTEKGGCVKWKSNNSSVLTKEDVLKILTSIDKDVENITSSKVDFVDVYEIHESMEKIASNKNLLFPTLLDRMLSVLGKLMNINIAILRHVVGTKSNSDRLRTLLEVLGKNVILKDNDFLSQSENIGISVKGVSGGDQPKDFYCTGFLRTSHDNKQKVEMVVSNESSELGEGYAQVQIPLTEMLEAMLDEQRNITRLTVMMLRKASFFETVHPLIDKRAVGSGNAYNVSEKINSWVVGVFVKGYNLTQLPRSFTIKFRKLTGGFDSTISMRWGADPFSDRKTWIYDGCGNSTYSDTTATCISKRLAFFAVLSENYAHGTNHKSIFHYLYQYIAMFGNVVCALECLITILNMSIFVNRIEKDVFKVIILNFTASVLLSNVSILCLTLGHLFLDDLVCEFVVLFLFYTLLVSQLWVVVFALFLFLYVGYPHRFDQIFRHILQVCLATWGVPAVYMAIVIVTLHDTNGFTFQSRPVCILHGLNEFIYFLPLFILLLVLALVLIVKTFLLPWQTTNEIEASQSSVSSSNSSSTDTFVDSVTDQFSACLVFFLLLSVSSMFLYSVLWQNNMLVSSLYAILVVFLGAAIMVMPWNFLSHIV